MHTKDDYNKKKDIFFYQFRPLNSFTDFSFFFSSFLLSSILVHNKWSYHFKHSMLLFFMMRSQQRWHHTIANHLPFSYIFASILTPEYIYLYRHTDIKAPHIGHQKCFDFCTIIVFGVIFFETIYQEIVSWNQNRKNTIRLQ